MQRVELTDNKKKGRHKSTVYQVKLLVDIDKDHLAGSLGGWVESVDNITNPKTGEIEGVVLDDAEILCRSRVYNNAVVKGSTKVWKDHMYEVGENLYYTQEQIDEYAMHINKILDEYNTD